MNTIGETVERKPKGFGLSRFLPKSQVHRPLPKMGSGFKISFGIIKIKSFLLIFSTFTKIPFTHFRVFRDYLQITQNCRYFLLP
jgi:hypothetical protein